MLLQPVELLVLGAGLVVAGVVAREVWRGRRPPATVPAPRLPPALIDRLVNHGDSTPDGFAGTVHDVIARDCLRLVPGDPDVLVRGTGRGPLQPWELVVTDLLDERRLPGGGVPPGALVGSGERDTVLARFAAEVTRAARETGLARRTMRLRWLWAVVPGPLVGLAAAFGPSGPGWILLGVFGVNAVGAGVLAIVARWPTAPARRALALLDGRRRDSAAGPGTRAFADSVALGLIGTAEHEVAMDPPAGYAWSPASGAWRLVPLLGPTGRLWFLANPPDRMTGVIVHREIDVPARRRSSYRLAIHDGRRKEAVLFVCSEEFFSSVKLGTWMEVEIERYTGKLRRSDVLRGGSGPSVGVDRQPVLPFETAPPVEVPPPVAPRPTAPQPVVVTRPAAPRPVAIPRPAVTPRPPARPWSVDRAPRPLLAASDIARLVGRPVTAGAPSAEGELTSTCYQVGGSPSGEVEVVVFSGRSAAGLRVARDAPLTLQGPEATVLGPTRVVLVTVNGLDAPARRRLAARIGRLVDSRLWSRSGRWG